MRSISLAVDMTNYVMLETGQPIHAYDADRLDGPIVVRQALGRREADHARRRGPAAARRRPVDHRPHRADRSGRGDGRGDDRDLRATTNVIIEAAHFDAMTIARTSRRHKLSSEASRRFERGVDPAATYAAAHRVARLLVELAGGTLSGGGDGPRFAAAPADHHASPTRCPARILGTEVDHGTAVALISSIGAASTMIDERPLSITAPSWRPDLTDPYDYVEEVGRLIGYDTIPPASCRRRRSAAG